VKINNNFNSLFQESEIINHPQTIRIRKQIIDHRNKNGLLVLVGHFVNISALTGVGVESGEGVLVRAEANGKLKVMGFSPKP
jgi:hypothetical protein